MFLFEVIDRFNFNKGCVIVTGEPSKEVVLPKSGDLIRIELKQFGESINVTVDDSELMRNCFSPERPRPMAIKFSADMDLSRVQSGDLVYSYDN